MYLCSFDVFYFAVAALKSFLKHTITLMFFFISPCQYSRAFSGIRSWQHSRASSSIRPWQHSRNYLINPQLMKATMIHLSE